MLCIEGRCSLCGGRGCYANSIEGRVGLALSRRAPRKCSTQRERGRVDKDLQVPWKDDDPRHVEEICRTRRPNDTERGESQQQLALYRVVTRDVDRFPELGMQYQKDAFAGRTEILVKYLGRTARTNKWIVTSGQRAGVVYEALLRADIFESVLHGIRFPEPRVLSGNRHVEADGSYNSSLGAD